MVWSPSTALQPWGKPRWVQPNVSGVFDPLTLSPALWLKADAGTFQTSGGSAAVADSDPVGEWQDQSGNGRHFTTAGSARPILKLAIQNGRSVIRFDGTDDKMSLASFAAFPSKRGTIVAAIKSATLNIGTILSTFDGTDPDWQFTCGAEASIRPFSFYDTFSGTLRLEASAVLTGWHIVALVREGDTTVRWYRDGVDTGTVAVATNQLAVNTLHLGSYIFGGSGGDFFNQDMGEIIVFDRDLTAGEVGQLNTYANTRWAAY